MPKINPSQLGGITTIIAPIISTAILPTILEQMVEVSGGITPGQHETLPQSIHFISDGPGHGFASGAYKEITGLPFPSSIVWYTDSEKSKKIVEKIIVRNSNQMPISITWNVYNTDGITIVNSLFDTINYTNNIFEINRTRTIII
jgi:hypothetical protein